MSKEESYKHNEMQEIIHYLEKTPIKKNYQLPVHHHHKIVI